MPFGNPENEDDLPSAYKKAPVFTGALDVSVFLRWHYPDQVFWV